MSLSVYLLFFTLFSFFCFFLFYLGGGIGEFKKILTYYRIRIKYPSHNFRQRRVVRGGTYVFFLKWYLRGKIVTQFYISIWAVPENNKKQNWEGVGIFIFFKDSEADTGGRGGGAGS